jgi:ubiquinone/menaquinone biosynthesis C-methylase UbiE
MDVNEYNSAAWDNEVESSNRWTRPVGSEAIAAARKGDWHIVLTPVKPIPDEWLGDVRDKYILCLASGGGQQAPILAAAGANVTLLDNSAKQLEQDRQVAERDGLKFHIEKGDAADLSRFGDESFDIIVNPCSNCFMPDLRPVWAECFRVLKPGGSLLVGFCKPEVFIFDRSLEERNGILAVRHSLPYSDQESLTEEELRQMLHKKEPLEFSHTLEMQIGGQIAAGFCITGLYEDYWGEPTSLFDQYLPAFIATRALKPR